MADLDTFRNCFSFTVEQIDKMAALDNFRNCSNLTAEETTVIALVRGVSAAVCCAISSTVLVVLVILAILPKTRNRVCGTLLKRLSFELIALDALYQLNSALQLVYNYNHDEKYCKVNGFFGQYFQSVSLLLVLGINLALFFKIGEKLFPSWRLFHCCKKAKKKMFTRHDMKISKPEVAIVASVIVLPLLFDWIPFTTNTYGQFATWCWIHSLEQNCSTNLAGLLEQIWLWDVPFGIVSFVILVLFVGSLCQLGYGIKNAKVHRLIQVGAVDYLLFLTFFVFASAFTVLAITFTFSLRCRFISWILLAVSSPLIGTFASLALLVAIYLPISATCILYHKRHQYQERDNQAHEDEPITVNRSDPIDLPSYTTWDPPHSTPYELMSSNELHVVI